MGLAQNITISNLELTKFFFAIILLLISAHFFGHLFQRLKMPKVIGEIFGGVVLGPSLIGYFAPTVFEKIFSGDGKLLAIIYWLGLVLLMFTSGFEVQSKFDKKDKKVVTALVIGSTIIPFIFGWWITSFFDVSKLIGPENNLLALKIIVSVAMAVTSIPVISKMFLDLGIINTRFAKIILGAATLHDIILWVFVTIATSLVAATVVSAQNILTHVLISIAFFALALLGIPRLIKLIGRLKIRVIPQNFEMGFAISVLLIFVAVASYFDINVIFGAFLAGIAIGYLKSPNFEKVKTSVKDFSLAFFVPIYFAIVGIKLDLIHHFDPLFFIAFFLFATAVQIFAVIVTAKLLKYGWLSAFNLAIAMNERGGPGIVLATLAFDLGIVNENFFVTLVINAILTSLIGGIWFRYVIAKKWELLEEKDSKTADLKTIN